MKEDSDNVMTIEDVAEFLRIPVSSVYRLAQGGKIPGHKVGRHWRFYRPTLQQWIAAQTNFDEKPAAAKKMDFS